MKRKYPMLVLVADMGYFGIESMPVLGKLL